MTAGLLQAKVEVADESSGGADIVMRSGRVEIVVEVKREDSDIGFESLRAKYAVQATEYSNTNVGFGFLLVLDRIRTDGSAGNSEDELAVTSVLKQGSTVPRALVMATVPALRKTPSSLVLKRS